MSEKELALTEETTEALSALPIDIAVQLGDVSGAAPRKEIAARLRELTHQERISKGIVASQGVFESKIFIAAQKAFNLLEIAMDPTVPKKDRPSEQCIKAANGMIDLYMKRFPKIVDVKPQVVINKKVYDIPVGPKAWFVKDGALLHSATWKAAEKAFEKVGGTGSGCDLNNGGPCVGTLKLKPSAPEQDD